MTQAPGLVEGQAEKAAPSVAGGNPGPRHIQSHHGTTGLADRPVVMLEPHPQGQGASNACAAVSAAAATARKAEHGERLRRRLIVLGVLTAVIAVDQAAKWWAWRHVAGVDVNPGGDMLTGIRISRLYAKPASGALLDLADFGLVSVAAAALVRRRLPAVITVCGALMVGGWASNLLDRLGMHYLTAPGSIRGVVDFIAMAGTRWNIADVAIIGATPLFLLSAAFLAGRAAWRHAGGQATPAMRIWLRPRLLLTALAFAAVVVTVALGAVHYGKLSRPAPARTRICQQPGTTQTVYSGGLVTQAMCQRP